MKRLFAIILCVGLTISVLAQQRTKASEKPSGNGLPQLIDRELFFGNPEITAAQISPNGRFITFLKPWKDTRNIYVKGVDEPFSAARLLTTETKRPIPGYFWTRDSKYILYVKDNDGDENFNVFAVDPAAKPAAGTDAAPSRDLTGLKGVRVYLYSLPKTDPDVAYIGLNDRDKSWHDLYKLTISTGEKSLVRKNTDRITGWEFDLAGKLRLAARTPENGDTEILRVDSDKFTRIYSCNVFESCDPVRFQKDGKRVYIETNKGTDLVSLALLDPETGNAEVVESDPLKKVDLGGAAFSEATDQLILTSYEDDKDLRRYFKDKSFEADYKWLATKLPGMEFRAVSRTLDDTTDRLNVLTRFTFPVKNRTHGASIVSIRKMSLLSGDIFRADRTSQSC